MSPLNRRFRTKRTAAGVLLVALVLMSSLLFAADASPSKQDEEKWRADRKASLLAPDGWFSLVGLDWLRPGKTSVGSAKDNTIQLTGDAAAHVAVFDLEAQQVELLPPPSGFPAGLTVDGKPAQSGVAGEDKPLKIGTFTLVAIQRGDRFALRIKDAKAPTLLQFNGLKWYAPDEKYRVLAKWLPYTPPHDVEIPTVLGTTVKDKIPGVAEFVVDGQTVRLEPIVEGDKLFFILRDSTSHSTTYGAGRFLYTDLPSSGLNKQGELWLDFNHLQNPPCAYTPYATCPLPPPQNRLQVAIPAGEKRYHAE
jgi:uncharacterized protein (DUF1684 family)